MCNNHTAQLMLDRVSGAGIQSHTIIDNVGKLVREEAETSRAHREKRRSDRESGMNWDTYQRSVGSWLLSSKYDKGTYVFIKTCHKVTGS